MLTDRDAGFCSHAFPIVRITATRTTNFSALVPQQCADVFENGEEPWRVRLSELTTKKYQQALWLICVRDRQGDAPCQVHAAIRWPTTRWFNLQEPPLYRDCDTRRGEIHKKLVEAFTKNLGIDLPPRMHPQHAFFYYIAKLRARRHEETARRRIQNPSVLPRNRIGCKWFVDLICPGMCPQTELKRLITEAMKNLEQHEDLAAFAKSIQRHDFPGPSFAGAMREASASGSAGQRPKVSQAGKQAVERLTGPEDVALGDPSKSGGGESICDGARKCACRNIQAIRGDFSQESTMVAPGDSQLDEEEEDDLYPRQPKGAAANSQPRRPQAGKEAVEARIRTQKAIQGDFDDGESEESKSDDTHPPVEDLAERNRPWFPEVFESEAEEEKFYAWLVGECPLDQMRLDFDSDSTGSGAADANTEMKRDT
eukprot:scaffold2394_cov276-Pinguiococcus_pyrenoidosus.AAC.5